MLSLAMCNRLKKNKSIVSALLKENRNIGAAKLHRGEVVYLHQTDFRRKKRDRKLVGLVRDRNDSLGSVFLNVYDDHMENCPQTETCKLKFVSTTDWVKSTGMMSRQWFYEIWDWDQATGALRKLRGNLTVEEWQPLDGQGLPSRVQEKEGSIVSVRVDGLDLLG